MSHAKITDAYIIDTCKLSGNGTYIPGAITYSGRRKMEAIQWKDRAFARKEDANTFVREHFSKLNIPEAGNEGELRSV